MNMKKHIAALMIIGLLAGLAWAQQSELKANDEQALEAKAKTLTGTWLLTITPGEPGAPSFEGLYTFTSDGIALFSSVGPPVPGLGNPGHGVWEKTAANTFTVVWKQFTFDDIFTTNGSLVVKSTITLTGADTFTSQDTGKIFDLDGNEIVSISGTIQARRMKIE